MNRVAGLSHFPLLWISPPSQAQNRQTCVRVCHRSGEPRGPKNTSLMRRCVQFSQLHNFAWSLHCIKLRCIPACAKLDMFAFLKEFHLTSMLCCYFPPSLPPPHMIQLPCPWPLAIDTNTVSQETSLLLLLDASSSYCYSVSQNSLDDFAILDLAAL